MSIRENADELAKEIICQKQLEWCFASFREHVEDEGLSEFFEGT